LELVLSLEEAFHMKIPDDDLDLDVFRSVNTIATYINGRLGEED
jgi:acyl carrier protein